MIRILDTSTDDVLAALKGRTVTRDAETERIVAGIVDDVRQRGDAALLDNARRFDAPGLESIVVSREEIVDSQETDVYSKPFHGAIQQAASRVAAFHNEQHGVLTAGWTDGRLLTGRRRRDEKWIHPGHHWTMSNWAGAKIGQRMLPVESAGAYVPGGNATYPSSVLMNVLPGRSAGVADIAVTTPARPDGTLAPEVLYALFVTGTFKAFKIGGAAAIAALALGTESVPRVDKIVGPGNRFVNEAKRQLWGQVGLDGYAGPSEVCVLADDAANDAFAAADLLTQVEHAPDNAGFLVCLSRGKLDAILAAAERQLAGAPREATMRAALCDNGLAIVARDLAEAIDIVNAIAPEHLTLAVERPEKAMEGVRNAGCILLGEYTPESAGDYCLGPSHTLPTSGAARWQSPVNVLDFLKVQSVVRLTREELQPLIPTIETMAAVEGFPAHGYGATVRRAEG